MTRPTDDRILAFLEGEMEEEERVGFVEQVESSSELARELRLAAIGLEAVQELRPVEVDAGANRTAARSRMVPPWWVAAASVATLAFAIPATLAWSNARLSTPPLAALDSGQPLSPDPSFVLLLHGRWPDAAAVGQAESTRRASEYWDWVTSLAENDVLVAAGDLRWEPGERIGPAGQLVSVASEVVGTPDFIVGMFALRVGTYEEAMALARDCPHLRYGGSVSVRQVGAGFVTTAGMGDWGP